MYVLRRKPGTNVFRPESPEHPEDESFPGLLLLRPEGPIFFANAAQIAHKIEPLVRKTQPKSSRWTLAESSTWSTPRSKFSHKLRGGKVRMAFDYGWLA